MTPPDRLIAATSAIGLIAMLAGCFDREPVVQSIPFATAFHCPPHGPGLSRTLVVFVDEDETGAIVGLSCARMRERGRTGVGL